jgi:hypothetical protein
MEKTHVTAKQKCREPSGRRADCSRLRGPAVFMLGGSTWKVSLRQAIATLPQLAERASTRANINSSVSTAGQGSPLVRGALGIRRVVCSTWNTSLRRHQRTVNCAGLHVSRKHAVSRRWRLNRRWFGEGSSINDTRFAPAARRYTRPSALWRTGGAVGSESATPATQCFANRRAGFPPLMSRPTSSFGAPRCVATPTADRGGFRVSRTREHPDGRGTGTRLSAVGVSPHLVRDGGVADRPASVFPDRAQPSGPSRWAFRRRAHPSSVMRSVLDPCRDAGANAPLTAQPSGVGASPNDRRCSLRSSHAGTNAPSARASVFREHAPIDGPSALAMSCLDPLVATSTPTRRALEFANTHEPTDR